MKRLSLVFLLLVGLASPALADQIQIGYSGSSYGPYQSGSGGEFTVNPVNPAGWLDLSGYLSGTTRDIGVTGTFQTFCIEMSEYISGYSATYNAEINQNAMYGGAGGGASGDPVSVGAGWLYSQFALGTLQGYNYGSDRLASAAALQQAIWYLEGEVASAAGNPFVALVISQPQFGTIGAAKADGGNTYGVFALNLTNPATGVRAQDQLYFHRVPDGGMTLMLLGGALIGLGALRRRFRG
jgi:hypothetical protein